MTEPADWSGALDEAERALCIDSAEDTEFNFSGHTVLRYEATVAALEARLRDADRRELTLRKEWWLAHGYAMHGCTSALYGDDGEMQCSVCRLDFRRQSVKEIQERLFQLGLARLAEQQADTPQVAP